MDENTENAIVNAIGDLGVKLDKHESILRDITDTLKTTNHILISMDKRINDIDKRLQRIEDNAA